MFNQGGFGDPGVESATFVVQAIDGHNVQDVLQQSIKQPLVLACWSPQNSESEAAVKSLGALLVQFGGRVAMATLDIEAHPMIAQQLGVMRVPQAKLLMQGQILAEFSGTEPEDQLIGVFTQLVGPPDAIEPEAEEPESDDDMQRFLAEVDQYLVQGNFAQAQQALEGALAQAEDQSEDSQRIRIKLIHTYLAQDAVETAEAEVEKLPESSPERSEASAMVFIAQQVKTLEPQAQLAERLEASDKDHEARFGLAIYAMQAKDYDQAQALLFQLLIKARGFQEGIAQRALVVLLDLISPLDPDRAKSIRRKMFSLLH